MALIGTHGPAVVLDARTCAWLEKYAGLSSLRVRVRGTDPTISRELEEVRAAAMSWRTSATGSAVETKPEPAADSNTWMTTGQAGRLVGISDRAIRAAISTGRLAAIELDGRYRISREDLEHYRAGREQRSHR